MKYTTTMYPARDIYQLIMKIADVMVYLVNQMVRISSENVRKWSKITIAGYNQLKEQNLLNFDCLLVEARVMYLFNSLVSHCLSLVGTVTLKPN